MRSIGRGEHGRPRRHALLGLAVVNVMGRQQAEAGVMVHGFLIALILKANPRMTGVLFETPAVIQDAKKHIEAAGLALRCETVAGDFFESIPEGGDAHVFSHVIQSLLMTPVSRSY